MKGDEPLFIILNAGSGRSDTETVIATIRQILDGAGRRYELLIAKASGDIASLAQQAVRLAQEQQGVIVAAGGDGTVNAVAGTALESERPFGVLPRGTFNFFAREHGLPLEIDEAVKALLTASIRPVQVGLANGRTFLVNASMGLYPQLLEDREQFKQQFGRRQSVALWSGIVTLLRKHRRWAVKLEYDGQAQIIRTPTVFIGNNKLQLERLGIPEAREVERGRLVALTVTPLKRNEMVKLLFHGAFGRLGQADEVTSFSFTHLNLQPALPHGRRGVKVAMDGEITLLRAPLSFTIAPRPLLLLVPATRDDSQTAK
jgi:diacylglycerol kinase family enzyme